MKICTVINVAQFFPFSLLLKYSWHEFKVILCSVIFAYMLDAHTHTSNKHTDTCILFYFLGTKIIVVIIIINMQKI